MVRKLLCIIAMSIVATLAFESVATAQYVTEYSHDECSGAAEQRGIPSVEYLNFIQDVGGCVAFEGTGPNATVGAHNAPVFDPETGEELGILRDLDPDLSSGDFSTSYEEFCGDFIPQILTAQDYYDQQANAPEQAILDPDSDGLACTADDDAFLLGDGGGAEIEPQCIDGILDRDGDGQISPVEAAQAGADATQGGDPCSGASDDQYGNGGVADDEAEGVGDCAGADEQLGIPSGSFGGAFISDAEGCIYLTGELIETTLDQLNAPVYDPDTGEELGLVKDLDPDLSGGDFSVSFDEFCGAFPTPEAEGFSYAGLTAQEYHDQLANDKERAILDPDSDGLACTDEDVAFLSGDDPDYDYEPQFEFDQTWNGLVTQTAEDGTESEFWVEADIIPVSEMTDDLIGDVVGEVVLVGLDCGGVWVLEEVNVDYVVVEERITEGTVENCVEFVPITLTPREDGALEYYFLDMNESVGEGILTRRGTVLSDDEDARKPSEKMDRLGMNELPDTGGSPLLAPLGALFLASGIFVGISRRKR